MVCRLRARGIPMDSWIVTRIRATSLRRVIVWTLALVAGVFLATSDRRYIANFLRGPHALAKADLDTIREESGAYTALAIGNRYLVVRTAGDESSIAEGKLAPWPENFENQLFDSKEMRSLRSRFYPFYLDSDSFRRPGFVVIGVGILFLLLFAWQALPALRAWRDPERHPLAKRIAQWGDPMGVAVGAEQEFQNPLLTGKAGWRFGSKYLVRSTFFTFNVLRFQDLMWGYKKVTKHSVNFIPTG